MVFTERDLGDHPTDIIDRALASTCSRETYPVDEVRDLLLDLQQALIRWSDECE